MNRPFLGSTALETGLLTRRELRAGYRAVYRGVYLANEVALTPRLRAQAAWLFAGPDAVLCGLSAAAVHGTKWLGGWSVIWVTKLTAEGRGSPGPVVLRAEEKLWAARERASRGALVPQSEDTDFVRSRARSAD